MSYKTIKVERRSLHLGGFIEGVDLTRSLAGEIVAEIENPHPLFDNDERDARLMIIESSNHCWRQGLL